MCSDMYPYTVEGLAATKPAFAFPQQPHAPTAASADVKSDVKADATLPAAVTTAAPEPTAPAAAAAAAVNANTTTGDSASVIAAAMPATENKCYDYDLVGVVIHAGVADAGHYYSYIKTRPDGTP